MGKACKVYDDYLLLTVLPSPRKRYNGYQYHYQCPGVLEVCLRMQSELDRPESIKVIS